MERLECLLDGIDAAFAHFGGVPRRVVLDNTSLAVKRVLRGKDREETDAFHGFRGSYPFHADFCAPRKGNEKGSVEGAVRYLRGLVFRPRPEVADLAELDRLLVAELDRDLDARRLPDGRTARQAWQAEKEHLRPLPAKRPECCRVAARVADKHGHVRYDGSVYSVPIEHAYRPVWAKAFASRIDFAAGDALVASHARSFRKGAYVLDRLHVLPLLERKHRAVSEATALQGVALPEVFHELRAALQERTRKPDREWVQVLRLAETHPIEEVARAAEAALRAGAPRLETVRHFLLRQEGPAPALPVALGREDLAAIAVAPVDLSAYDRLREGA